MVFPQDTVGWVKEVKDACIAVFTCSLGVTDTEAKGTVLIENAEQLMNFNKSEEKEVDKLRTGRPATCGSFIASSFVCCTRWSAWCRIWWTAASTAW